MSLILWSGALYVDDQEINNQHFRFVMILNELYESILWSEGDEVVIETLDKLEEYTRQHFAYEESLMEQMQSPLKTAHFDEHNQFRKKVEEMRERLKNGNQTIDMELSAYLNAWMLNHIQQMDHATFLPHPDE